MISVVIPTFDSANALRWSLPPLVAGAWSGLVKEVIFADGGSGDATPAIAEETGARLAPAELGRDAQEAAGARAARASWLLFLDPEIRLGEGWDEDARAFIADPSNRERAAFFPSDVAQAGAVLIATATYRARGARLPTSPDIVRLSVFAQRLSALR